MEPQNLAVDRLPNVKPEVQFAVPRGRGTNEPEFCDHSPRMLSQIHKDLTDLLKSLEDELQQLELNCLDRLKLERIIHLRKVQGSASKLLEDEDSSISVNENLSTQMKNLSELIERRQNTIRRLGHDIENKSTQTVNSVSVLLKKVKSDVKTWKETQKTRVSYEYEAKKGVQDETWSERLDEIQGDCEVLTDHLLKFRSNVNSVHGIRKRLHSYSSLANILWEDHRAQVLGMLEELAAASIIVEIQPPKVLTLRSHLPPITVRLLIGNAFSMYCNGQEVHADLASLEDLHVQTLEAFESVRIFENGSKGADSTNPREAVDPKSGISEASSTEDCNRLLNNTNTFKYSDQTKRCVASFKNLRLERVRKFKYSRNERSYETVFWFHFNTKIRIADLVFDISTLSNPFVVITNSAQYSNAVSAIFWNNVICHEHASLAGWAVKRVDRATWPAIAQELNDFFLSATGCNLSEENLAYLRTKIYREHNLNNDDLITKSNLCYEILPERSFTFWNWFHSTTSLFKADPIIKDLWNDKLLAGFIAREKTDELLKTCAAGTIILRFADSCLGGLSAACISSGGIMLHVAPSTADDLKKRCLINRLLEINEFKFIYPKIPLKDKIAEFVKPVDMTSAQIDKVNRGYVKPFMRAFLPGVTDSLRMMDSAPSPFPAMQPEHADSENVFDEVLDNITNNWPDESGMRPLTPTMDVDNLVMDVSDHDEPESIFVDLDVKIQKPGPSAVQSAEVSSNYSINTPDAFQSASTTDTSVPESSDDISVQKIKPDPVTQDGLKVKRRKVAAGFIMKKRDRDKSKSKRKKSLAKWAKDLTETCGCRVFLMVENAILCDSLDGGIDAIDLPESVRHEFERREPNVIPEEVLRRLFQNMRLSKCQPSSGSGLKRFRSSDSDSASQKSAAAATAKNTKQNPTTPKPGSSNDLSCAICVSKVDPLSRKLPAPKPTPVWLKCKTLIAQCNHYVHANCVGIYLSNQIEAQAIPFFCPEHLEDEIQRKSSVAMM